LESEYTDKYSFAISKIPIKAAKKAGNFQKKFAKHREKSKYLFIDF